MTWSQQESLRNTFSCDWRPEQRKMENIQIWEQNREMNGTVRFFCSSAPRAPSKPYLNATVYWVSQDMIPSCSPISFSTTVPKFSWSTLLWPLTVAQASQLLPNSHHSSLFSKSEMPPLGTMPASAVIWEGAPSGPGTLSRVQWSQAVGSSFSSWSWGWVLILSMP